MGCSASRLNKFLAVAIFANFFFVVYLFCVVGYDGDDEVGYVEPVVLPHHLCVVVPYRDRYEELSEFVPHLHKFLETQAVKHTLLVLNQTDSYRFNRASLINAGWNEADRIGCDYMVMHDVDLLPRNPEIDYRFPGEGVVRHISSPQYHPKYYYKNFIGGILMLTMKDYKALNGMSNKYWGWGLEDDEFFLRIKESSLNLTRVKGLNTDRTTSFRHIHGPDRKRDYTGPNKDEKALKKRRDRISGLLDVHYKISDRRTLHFGDAPVRVVGIQLFCNLKWTPYCRQTSARLR